MKNVIEINAKSEITDNLTASERKCLAEIRFTLSENPSLKYYEVLNELSFTAARALPSLKNKFSSFLAIDTYECFLRFVR
jgi:hypothetical protein